MTIRRWECRQKWKCCSGNPKYCFSPKGQAKTDAWAVIRRSELDTSMLDSTGVESNPTPWHKGITPWDTSGEKGTTSWKGASAQALTLPFSLLEVSLTEQAPQPSCCVDTGAGGEGKGQKLFQVMWTHLHQIGLPDTIQLAEVGHRAENSFVLLPS